MHYLTADDAKGKKILLRLDLDLPQDEQGKFDTTRMEDSFDTLTLLWQAQAKHVTVIAHRGHNPDLKKDSLAAIGDLLYKSLLKLPVFEHISRGELEAWLDILENLRFDPREEQNDLSFAKELAAGQDVFVNDAFATAHREHTSIVGIPKVLPTVFGLHFQQEVESFIPVFAPKRPYVFILGGAKLETKVPLLEQVAKKADRILIGGKLAVEAKFPDPTKPKIEFSANLQSKMLIADLTEDHFDISPAAADQFCKALSDAQTIVWNGPMGKYEETSHILGTKAVAESVAANQGYKLLGGGDTEAALTLLKIDQKKAFSHVSTGGGAMLYYLANETLPALDAVGP